MNRKVSVSDTHLDVYKRQGMALGQYIAGMGFSNVGLGIAHSMAHTCLLYTSRCV